MPSLKDLKMRIASVKSTRKITSAMKMVAASKLKRAQHAAEAARPYALRMERMVKTLVDAQGDATSTVKMLGGTGSDQVHLLIMVTADRGLCGGFNGNIVRLLRQMAAALLASGRQIKILSIGRKGRELIRRDYGAYLIEGYEHIGRKGVNFDEANTIGEHIVKMFDAGEFDVATLIYNRFKSAIEQVPTKNQLIPFTAEAEKTASAGVVKGEVDAVSKAVVLCEPSEEEILASLLPRYLDIRVFRALLESSAAEHAARMTSMDNATNNAGDMIDRLSLQYNRSRQAQITKDLIEIISGAEAL